MKFGAVSLAEAEGAILAHSVAAGGKRLRKGRRLSPEDVATLSAAGVTAVTVARLETGDVHEDAAADRLAAAILGQSPEALGLRATASSTGRVNLFAEVRGVVEVDAARVTAVNAVDPMITFATVPEWQHLGPGGMVATIKIIAYGVAESALAQAEAEARGALRMRPTAYQRVELIQTSVTDGDAETGHRAIVERCERLGLTIGETRVVAHEAGALAEALRASEADILLILTASATSDIRDTAPEALRQAGGEVIHYGMPVDPGNLLFLGQLGPRPVIGLPGCARSPARNGADWVLERVACGVPVGAHEIAGMGVGGLLKEIPERGHPRVAR